MKDYLDLRPDQVKGAHVTACLNAAHVACGEYRMGITPDVQIHLTSEMVAAMKASRETLTLTQRTFEKIIEGYVLRVLKVSYDRDTQTLHYDVAPRLDPSYGRGWLEQICLLLKSFEETLRCEAKSYAFHDFV